MPPSGLAILIGAGPNTGTGIARVLSSPTHTNLAIALLARRPDSLASVKADILSTTPEAVIKTFPTDTSSESLKDTFQSIRSHPSFKGLKLTAAIFSIKHSSKKPFLSETRDEFTESLDAYVGGAFSFAQESLKLLFEQHGEVGLKEGGGKKGTIIFTGTLGALRCNEGFAAYGAGRAGVRMVGQGLGREVSAKGVQVVHVIANGGIVDVKTDEERQQVLKGEKMSADAVGKTYGWLIGQEPGLWTSELDMRPACEKF